jgi:hypothetical protein
MPDLPGSSSRWEPLASVKIARPGPPIGAVLAERNDDWTESRRYMGLDILAACRKAAQLDMRQNRTSKAGLTIAAIPALNGNRS